jgi:hypothetical protein
MVFARAAVIACLALWPTAVVAQVSFPPGTEPRVDGITRLVDALEKAAGAGDAAAVRGVAADDLESDVLEDFVKALTAPRPTGATVKERDRAVTTPGHFRLLIETFVERGGEGRVSSWRLDVEPRAAIDGPWAISNIERLSIVSGLYRLTLDASSEYDVHNLAISVPDMTLTIPSGTAFLSKTPDGPTALVLLGKGRLDFSPQPEAERGQVHIFSGSDTLKTEFDSVFVRLNPATFGRTVDMGSLKPRAVDAGHLRRASQVFDTFVPKSYQIDLNDLSTARWSLVPSTEDFVAEIVTGKYGALTYARAGAEPEDISFFDRRRHRNIAVYSSSQKAAGHPAFFSEDDDRNYDITHYDVDTSFSPDRSWVDGTARLSLRARSFFSTLTVRLAEPLVVRSVTSPQFGRLLHLRIVGQNNILIGLPSTVVNDTDLDLVITYGGRLPPQGIDREAVMLQQQERGAEDVIVVPPEAQYTYSNRSYWYPQAPVTDYATAKLTITVPGDLDVVATGAQQGSPVSVEAPPGQRPRKRYVFEAKKPTRYLGVLISRLQSGAARELKLQDEDDPIPLSVVANPRQVSKARGMADKASDVLKFYASLMNDVPYDAFTLALTESDVPGGHSPAYFALLNQPLPTSPFTWNNDPVAFQNYPSFFIAHEIAHQWWGQAVGWKNYHEQWISEGFAQYFAALYAERERGPEQLTSVLRQMRKWAVDLSPQGPVYLGYRLGHLRGEGRTFRALVYNKGAMVLHMLRRLMGDQAFFSGLRDFYATWRFDKAGTDDFRVAMEKAGGKPLERFFDRWIYGSGIPVVRYTSTVANGELKLRFEQKGEVYDLPLTVTIGYSDGTTQDVLVTLAEKVVEQTIPLKGAVRSVDVNKDSAALVELER